MYSLLCCLATVTSYIDPSVRIVTKSPKLGPLSGTYRTSQGIYTMQHSGIVCFYTFSFTFCKKLASNRGEAYEHKYMEVKGVVIPPAPAPLTPFCSWLTFKYLITTVRYSPSSLSHFTITVPLNKPIPYYN